MVVMFNAKVKKFCISLLESAGSFAYTRGVMAELDASIRFPVQFLSHPSLQCQSFCLEYEESDTETIIQWHSLSFRAEVERLGGNGTLIEVLDQLKDWEED